jgi:putative membrane protein
VIDLALVTLASAHALVHLNAALNTLATVMLVAGFRLIKRGRVVAHARMMLATFLVSCLFLASYLIYHYQVGSVKFTHPGAVRYVYLTILATHVVLAAAVPFMAILTIVFALLGTGRLQKERLPAVSKIKFLARHRRLARWTFPVWLYVSVTGVVVYVMLYHLWPPATG